MTYTPQNTKDYRKKTGIVTNPGPFIAEIMNNQDPLKSGRLQVYISDFGGDANDPSSWDTVSYLSPFYGVSPLSNRTEPNLQQSTGQVESYGFWMQPPDVGVRVLVMFANGNRNQGFWIGCIPDIGAHGSIPAMDKGGVDVNTEENYKIASSGNIDAIERPDHSHSQTFAGQGLDQDQARGPVSSSSFRESPSRVFGFNTPAGHSLVMDDGEEGGQSTLIRIRSASGNQIMLNDDNGFVYIINAQGTGWLELSPSGQVDVYGSAGINLATEGDMNLHANGDMKLHAGGDLQLVGANTKIQGDQELEFVGEETRIQGISVLDMHSCEKVRLTSYGDIHQKAEGLFIVKGVCFQWNTGSPEDAEQVTPEEAEEVSGYNTTVTRAPSREPYDEHDGSAGTGPGSGGGAGGAGAPGTALPDSGFTDDGFFIPPAAETTIPLPTARPADIGGAPLPTARPAGIGQTQDNRRDILDQRRAQGASQLENNALTVDSSGLLSTLSPSGLADSIRSGVGSIQDGISTIKDKAAGALGNITGQMNSNMLGNLGGGMIGGSAGGANCAPPSDPGNPLSQGDPANQAQPGRRNFVPPDELKNDPAFQAELRRLQERYPTLTDQQIYNVIGHESSFNFGVVNSSSGATGGFQFIPSVARELGTSTAAIQNMTPAQQLNLYGRYLDRWNYQGGGLAIMQAAPAFANRPPNTIVYSVGSRAWQLNPAWRSAGNGPITVASINAWLGD